MIKVTPLEDRVIIRVIEQEAKSAGGIILNEKSLEESTLGEVLAPNQISYYRNGERREPKLAAGDQVRFAKQAGTQMPEAPDGETWIAIPEDMIYYKVESNDGW